MASEAQMEANRLNAARSTGPRTVAGRARSAQNARTHGLTAQSVVVDGEEAREFARFRQAQYAHWQPVGGFEVALVEEIATYTWRLRRLPRIEADILCQPAPRPELATVLKRLAGLDAPEEDPTPPEPDTLGVAFSRQDAQGELLTGKLPRYEARLSRRRLSAIALLVKSQARRQAADASARSTQSPARSDEAGPDLGPVRS
jgi:hypothetical protein